MITWQSPLRVKIWKNIWPVFCPEANPLCIRKKQTEDPNKIDTLPLNPQTGVVTRSRTDEASPLAPLSSWNLPRQNLLLRSDEVHVWRATLDLQAFPSLIST